MHEIKNYKIHKGYIWLLSIYKGGAYYSVHKWSITWTEKDVIPVASLSAIFQNDHDKQINSLIREQLVNKGKLSIAN